MPDGNNPSSTTALEDDQRPFVAKCGVVLIGHGNTASALLAAARSILPGAEGLDDAIAIDAGSGRTPELDETVSLAIESVDEGQGILLIVDLMGSSPCMCGIRESAGHGLAVLTGLNLAMLTKLATLDRSCSPRELAQTCADSVGRSICVNVRDADTPKPCG